MKKTMVNPATITVSVHKNGSDKERLPKITPIANKPLIGSNSPLTARERVLELRVMLEDPVKYNENP